MRTKGDIERDSQPNTSVVFTVMKSTKTFLKLISLLISPLKTFLPTITPIEMLCVVHLVFSFAAAGL